MTKVACINLRRDLCHQCVLQVARYGVGLGRGREEEMLVGVYTHAHKSLAGVGDSSC